MITNPLVAEESVLRTSLRPGLLKALAYNESHRIAEAPLFEIGHVYRLPAQPQPLPDEREILAVALAGRDARAAVALWQEIEAALHLDVAVQIIVGEPVGMHPTRSAFLVEIGVDPPLGSPLGLVGEIDPDVARAYGIDQRVAWLELDLELLLALPHGTASYNPVSRFPSSDIDLAFATPDELWAATLRDALRDAAEPLLVDLTLFDTYRGEGVLAGHRSLAWRLRLQATDRTLTDADLTDVRDRCVRAANALGATLRT